MNSRRFTAGPSHASDRKDNTALLRCGISIWPMSLVGLGRVKTFVLATRVENLGAIAEAES
jgi:hypothetical protein